MSLSTILGYLPDQKPVVGGIYSLINFIRSERQTITHMHKSTTKIQSNEIEIKRADSVCRNAQRSPEKRRKSVSPIKYTIYSTMQSDVKTTVINKNALTQENYPFLSYAIQNNQNKSYACASLNFVYTKKLLKTQLNRYKGKQISNLRSSAVTPTKNASMNIGRMPLKPLLKIQSKIKPSYHKQFKRRISIKISSIPKGECVFSKGEIGPWDH